MSVLTDSRSLWFCGPSSDSQKKEKECVALAAIMDLSEDQVWGQNWRVATDLLSGQKSRCVHTLPNVLAGHWICRRVQRATDSH